MRNATHLVIMGDFNLKEINWQRQATSVSGNHPATIFLEATRDLFLSQHVTEPTRIRESNNPSSLDLIFTNEENMIDKVEHNNGIG